MYHLVPPEALEEVVKVLTFGARKYGEGNWRMLENGPVRYFDAAQRHLAAWLAGQKTDAESGLPHLAHAACSLLFMLSLEMNEKQAD